MTTTTLHQRDALPNVRSHGRSLLVLGALLALVVGLAPLQGSLFLGAMLLLVAAVAYPIVPLAALLATAGVVGTGFAVEMGGAHLRVLDAVAFIGLAATLLRHLPAHRSPTELRTGLRLLAVIVLLGFIGVFGNSFDSVRADLFVLSYFPTAWMLAGEVATSPRWRPQLPTILTSVIAVTAVKAILLAAAPQSLSGPSSPWQAWSFPTSTGWRVILVGGDTFLLLGPALAVSLLASRRAALRATLVVGLALAALAFSQTRTSVLIAILGIGPSLSFWWFNREVRQRAQRAIRLALLVLPLLVLVVAVRPDPVHDLTSRALIRFDLRATGPLGSVHHALEQRQSETDAAAATLRDAHVFTGRGLGASYVSPLSQSPSTWTHNIIVWIMLKVGLIGLIASAWLGVRYLRRTWRVRRLPQYSDAFELLPIPLLLLLVSFTINRIISPEGMILLAIAIAWSSIPTRTST